MRCILPPPHFGARRGAAEVRNPLDERGVKQHYRMGSGQIAAGRRRQAGTVREPRHSSDWRTRFERLSVRHHLTGRIVSVDDLCHG